MHAFLDGERDSREEWPEKGRCIGGVVRSLVLYIWMGRMVGLRRLAVYKNRKGEKGDALQLCVQIDSYCTDKHIYTHLS